MPAVIRDPPRATRHPRFGGEQPAGLLYTSPVSTIFDRILDGQIPCHRVHEDAHALAFLDIGPLSRGHLLLIPKERKAHLHELSEESAAALGRVLPRLCRAVLQVTGASAYNVLQNNGSAAHQVVMHVHFHIIPQHEGRGLELNWRPGALEDGQALAGAIRAALER
jgi:histidine triad (HIT) family protein